MKRFIEFASHNFVTIWCVKPWSQDWLTPAGAYPGFCSMKRLEVFLLHLNGMLLQPRSRPRHLLGFPQQFAGIHLYTWVERHRESKVSCPRTLARTWTRTAHSGVECTNHEATVPTLDGTPSLELPACADGWALWPHTSSEYATGQLYNLKVYHNLPGMHACNNIHLRARHYQLFLYTGFILFEDFKIPWLSMAFSMTKV